MSDDQLTNQLPTASGSGVAPSRIAERVFAFGPFAFYPSRHLLLEHGKPIPLGSRASAILEALVENAGQFLTNSVLTQIAWPTTHVDEGNLRVHISALRRALNDRRQDPLYIANTVGRGYRFVASVSGLAANTVPQDQSATASGMSDGLPSPLVHIIGRNEDISAIQRLLSERRLVSIVGPGGIGKTTVATAAAYGVQSQFSDGAYFIDLASVSDPTMVPFAVASALRASIETNRPFSSLLGLLKDSHVLLLLDNCEHLITAAAELVDTLLRGSPRLTILTTSHEPLRSEGERVFRLQPFDVPDDTSDMSLEQALAYPSIELFVDRARSDQLSWQLEDADVPFIAEICRRLDGLPLAIEMAASRAEVFGIGDLAARLDDRFDLLTGGKRTAAARQQTIRGMLDWSHENLATPEKVVLRRLSVFAGSFGLPAAHFVAGDESLSPFALTDAVAGLARKSLLSLNNASGKVTYRLLESMRLYGLEKLDAALELPRLRRLHIHYLLDELRAATAVWTTTPRREWLDTYGKVLDDVRSALAWAFSDVGDAASGVALTALAMPVGLQLGLVDEFRTRIETAIVRARSLSTPQRVEEMRLNLVYGILNQNQIHPNSISAMGLDRAVELAEEIGSDVIRIEPQILLGAYTMSMGNYPAALKHAESANALSLAVGDDIALVASRRILSQVSHFSGDHARAVDLARTVLSHPIVNIPVAFGSVQTDRRVSMRIVLARARWMQGFADEAVAIINEAIDIAPEDGPLALCQALALGACPVLLWRGDDQQTRDHSGLLREQASRYTLHHWHSWGLLFEAVLDERAGTRSGPANPQGDLQRETLATFTGRLDDLEKPVDVVERSWSAPEQLRIRGEASVSASVLEAEALFQKSLQLARLHGALAWELRTATSITSLWRHSSRQQEAVDLLGSVLGRFTEGQTTADFRLAQTLLDDVLQQ